MILLIAETGKIVIIVEKPERRKGHVSIFAPQVWVKIMRMYEHTHHEVSREGGKKIKNVKKKKKERGSTSQMPPSEGRLFFGKRPPHPCTMAWKRAENKCVPPYGRSDCEAGQIFLREFITGRESESWISTHWHTKPLPQGPDFLVLWCFNNEAVLDSPAEAVAV